MAGKALTSSYPTVSSVSSARASQNKGHADLWAGLSVSGPVFYVGLDTNVQLLFALVNDSGKPLDCKARSWRIVINGNELADSGWIFGNGPGPVGGWGTLRPGESYEFGKALPLLRYFSAPGTYEVSWHGETFHSPTVVFRVQPRKQAISH